MKNSKLIDLVKEHAVKHGKFKLSSGQESDYFIDMSLVTNRSDALDIITFQIMLYLEEKKLKIDAVGGPVLGCAPLIGGMLLTYARFYYGQGLLRGFLIRKEAKNEKLIEGDLREGDKVLILEDVVTTGLQVKRTCDIVESMGAKVCGIIAVVDRLAGAAELLSKWNYKSMMTIEDLEIKNG